MDARHHICLFLTTSDFGGTERMALAFLRDCDRSRFVPSLISLLGQGPVPDAAARLGLPCVALNWKGIWDRRAFRAFRSFLREHRIDLIHNFGLRAELISRPVSKRTGVRRIVSGIRDTDAWRRWPHVWADRLTAGSVDLFIANSEAARQATMTREKVPARKIITIHNGLPLPPSGPDVETARRDLALSPDAGPIVVQVANYKVHKKGHDVLLAAVQKLKDEFPQAVFVCVGQDFGNQELARLVEENGLSDRVRLTGYQDNVFPYLAMADVAVLPSRYESLPVSVMEAMAMGLPVAATRVGGLPELIEDGVNGLLIEPNDARALADRLRFLFNDPAARQKLGQAARETIRNRFSMERMIDRIQNAYTGLLAGDS